MIVKILLSILVLLVVGFAFFLVRDVIAHKDEPKARPYWLYGLTGLITDFLDTLGIGSFVVTTAIFKATKAVDDKLIPGTLNISHAIPTAVQALIFIYVVQVDVLTLVSLILAAVAGAWLGAGIVTKFNKRTVQLTMGIALTLAALLMILTVNGPIEGRGDATALTGGLLITGIVGNFVLGVMMTAGIGLYAPCMAMLLLLGMSPLVVFPVMMGSCAFLMPVAGVRFIKAGRYARKPAISIAILGCLGVVIAAYVVTSLPIKILKIVIIVVVLYTSAVMLYSARKK